MSTDESEHVVEEDWSTFVSETTGFAQHETQLVRLSPSSSSQTLSIASVPALSPLDMMNLSNGNHDATGHVVWLGAFFFIEALARIDYMKGLFRGKSVLELGCGSGVSGLALLLTGQNNSPSSLLFTDSDPASLELCERNCKSNLLPDNDRYSIAKLTWGDDSHLECSFDVVLATDVLYDISSLKLLLLTVDRVLTENGHFVLAHIPRASLPGEAKVGSVERLESFIIDQARKFKLELERIVRPRDVCGDIHYSALNDVSFREMEDAGAAILMFVRCD